MGLNIVNLLGWAFCALAVAGCAYGVLAAALLEQFLAKSVARPAATPSVTILKPLHGSPPGLEAALTSFCRQDYPAPIQILLGVHDPADPAIAVAEKLRKDQSHLEISVVVDKTLHGQNRKISNLINLMPHIENEVIVMSDADIEVTPGYLRAVMGEFAHPAVGAVTCLYRGRAGNGAWSALSAMAIDYQFLPNAVLGAALGMATPCFGSTIAFKAALLERIGGFAAFADGLADDYEIGAAVRRLGLEVRIPPMVVAHVCTEAGPREFLEHEVRWARTVRRIDPAGFAGSAVTYALPLALLGAALLGFPPPALGLIFATLAVRMAVKLSIDAAVGGRGGPWWLLPVSDVLSFAVFLISFAGDTVVWRGDRFHVGRDGVLTEVSEAKT